jgi:hypothetical protein
MSMSQGGHPIYEALMIPTEALDKGGVEILRAGIVDGELYVTARRAFKEPSKWGDVLADTARRIALLYSAEDTDLSEAEILTDIMEAIVADLGAPKVAVKSAKSKSAKTKPAKAKRAAPKRAKSRSSSKRKSVKRSKKR